MSASNTYLLEPKQAKQVSQARGYDIYIYVYIHRFVQ